MQIRWPESCFNPRPRAGGDLGEDVDKMINVSFNPRPRAGGDGDTDTVGKYYIVSIHAPARGAT